MRTLLRVVGVLAAVAVGVGLLQLIGSLLLHFADPLEAPELPAELEGQVLRHGRSPETVPDPYLLYTVKPDLETPHARTNAWGLRADPIEETPGPDTFRILVLGGSTAWGYTSLSNDDTIAARLQHYLDEQKATSPALRGKTVEVLNGGVPGYSSWQEALLYSIYHRRLKPQVVITLDGANEYYSAIRLGKAGLPMRFDVASKSYVKGKPTLLGGLGEWLQYRLHRLKIARYLRQRKRPTLEELNPAPPDAVAAEYRRALDHLADIAAADDALVVPVLQPLVILPDTKPLSPFEEELVEGHEATIPGVNAAYGASYEAIRPMLRDLDAERSNVRSLDATDVFADEPETAYIDYCHLSPRGREVLAQGIGDFLLESLGSPQPR